MELLYAWLYEWPCGPDLVKMSFTFPGPPWFVQGWVCDVCHSWYNSILEFCLTIRKENSPFPLNRKLGTCKAGVVTNRTWRQWKQHKRWETEGQSKHFLVTSVNKFPYLLKQSPDYRSFQWMSYMWCRY